VIEDGEALQFVKNQTNKIVVEALKNNSNAIKFVDNSMVEMFIASLTEKE